MKRQLTRAVVSFLLTFVLVLGLVPGAAWAATVSGDGKTITLEVGETYEFTLDGLHGTEVTDVETADGILRYSLDHKTVTTEATTTTEISDSPNGTYKIGNGSNVWLTFNGGSFGTTTDPTQATDWTITKSGDTYQITHGSNTLGWNRSENSWYLGTEYSYSFSLNGTYTTWTYSESNGFYSSLPGGTIFGSSTGNSNYYLSYNDGVQFSTSGPGLAAYTATTTPGTTASTTTITFTGLKPGTTTVEIGGETYTVIVEPLKEAVELWVDEAAGSYPVTGEVSDTEIKNFNEKYGSVVTVSESGGNLIFTPVGKGTIAAVLGNTQYTVNVSAPTYTVDITYTDGTSVTAPIIIKEVKDTTTYDLNALVKYVTSSSAEEVPNAVIGWRITSDPDNAASGVDENGVVSFIGVDGTVQISAYYELPDKSAVYDTVTFSVTNSKYTVPGDGTDDFPEYPNEGAVRIDKTATAVGNFSETGLAMVEISMTGVPYTKGSEIDVVIMVDMSGSMNYSSNEIADRVQPAKDAVIAAVNALVKNEDGSFNKNRVAIYTFAGNSTGPLNPNSNWSCELQTFDADALAAMETGVSQWSAKGSTDYTASLKKCQEVLQSAAAATDYNRKQFCVFVTDGAPTISFTRRNSSGQAEVITGTGSQSGEDLEIMAGYTEYYSYEMKNAGVEVFTIGIQMTENSDEGTIVKKIAGLKLDDGKNTFVDATTQNYEKYSRFVKSDISELSTIFSDIVVEIKQAATDVVVEDKISPDYSMVFEKPQEVKSEAAEKQAYYIQVVEYELDENKERKGDPVVLEKFWKDENGVWQHNSGTTSCKDGCPHVTIVNDKVEKIDGTYFDTSFKYDADEQLLIWEADKLDTKELALQYFVYLDDHASEKGESGTYQTNEYAKISYTNYQDNQCQQEFPVPQLTYNGAQVSYVFYLVNENGEPVNRAGRVVPFAEAVYVTDVLTYATTWTSNDTSGQLDVYYLAQNKLPGAFTIYDDAAYYQIYVSADASQPDYFIIEGGKTDSNGNTTTKVFNTKAGDRYEKIGAYSTHTGDYQSKLSEAVYKVEEKTEGFDFANTTVAFAVKWSAELDEDFVVMDFGLPVSIDVAWNDALNGSVIGVRASAPAGAEINSGSYAVPTRNSSTDILDTSGIIVGKAYLLNGTSVRIELNKILDRPAKFFYEYEATYYYGDELVVRYLYSSVTLVPATNVLYEESFISADSRWRPDSSGVGTAAGTSQSEKNEVPYGYDNAYQVSTGSSGTQFVASLSPDGKERFADNLSFTFTGTGFDLIGSCSSDTATLMVRVNDANGNYVKGYMVDTAFLNTNGVDADGKLYQVPLVHEDGLTWGTYTVTITGAYVAYDYQKTAPDTMKLEIDGFRVYRTGSMAEHTAFVSGEKNVTYVNIMNEVQTLNDAIAYVDSAETGYSVSNYESVGGPENEVYVKPGQSIVLKTAADWHQVSLRSVTEKKTTALLKTNKSQVEYEIAHNTEMYYAVEEESSGILTITNTGDSLLAVGNVKLYSTGTNVASLAAVSAEDLPVVYAMLSRPVEPVFHPENLTMKAECVVQDGQKFVTLTVTASTDVRKLTVNGTAVWANNYTQVQQGLENEYVFTVLQIVSPSEMAAFEVIAVDKDGVAAEMYTISE